MLEQLRVMVVGAHPDDPEYQAGGYAALMMRLGHRVRFVSMTDGSAGHQAMLPGELAAVRKRETEMVSEVSGVEYTVMPIEDGYLEATCVNRDLLIAELRDFQPHLIITHRPYDYHPDHRNTGVLVQDASYLVMVPNVCPKAPALQFQPVIAYSSDRFTQPTAFAPTVVVDIDGVIGEKMRMAHCHTSQFYDWLPWVGHYADCVPEGEEQRLAWLTEQRSPRMAAVADRHRGMLIAKYGERGRGIKLCEAFQISEYGEVPDDGGLRRLFPV